MRPWRSLSGHSWLKQFWSLKLLFSFHFFKSSFFCPAQSLIFVMNKLKNPTLLNQWDFRMKGQRSRSISLFVNLRFKRVILLVWNLKKDLFWKFESFKINLNVQAFEDIWQKWKNVTYVCLIWKIKTTLFVPQYPKPKFSLNMQSLPIAKS